VPRQVLRHARRPARQIRRRRHQHAPRRCQKPRDQAGIGQHSHAQRHVETLLDRVDDAVVQRQFNPQLGILRHERGQQRPQMQHAEGDRRVDPQHAARLVVQARHPRLGLLHKRQDIGAAFIVGAPRLGRAHPPCGAVQQPRAQPMFQFHHRLAHGGTGQTQRAPGLGIAPARDGRAGAVRIHRDVDLHASVLDAGQALAHRLAPGRTAWVQVVRGSVRVNGTELGEGDAAALAEAGTLAIAAPTGAELLLFDIGA
jgi:hypothetical protein